jgi:hypothetical protein
MDILWEIKELGSDAKRPCSVTIQFIYFAGWLAGWLVGWFVGGARGTEVGSDTML